MRYRKEKRIRDYVRPRKNVKLFTQCVNNLVDRRIRFFFKSSIFITFEADLNVKVLS